MLAQICTYNDQLPQGAPTSPVLSNMICRKLDKEFIRYAKHLQIKYSRYADDLSFSWNQPELVEKIFSRNSETLATEIIDIVEQNGFRINKNKIQARTHLERQLVTGIKVNNIAPNLIREFPRQIRAMLHAWEKYGYEAAEIEYHQKYLTKHRFSSASLPIFRRVIKGKLNYIRMVCGPDHSTYQKLLHQFSRLSGQLNTSIIREQLAEPIWVIENESTGEQGTAFELDNVGIITAAHLINSDDTVYAFKPSQPDNRLPVIFIWSDEECDVAIVGFKAESKFKFTADFDWNPKNGAHILVAGYPLYKDHGDQIFIDEGKIVQQRKLPKTEIPWYVVNAKIIAGNSGGPVLNRFNKVVGIVVTGSQSIDAADSKDSNKHGFVSIDRILSYAH